jgi:hypothetical protein
MFSKMFSSIIFALSLVLGVCAGSHTHQNRHNAIAKRHSADLQLYKRGTFSNAKFTYYDVGLFVVEL